MFSLLKKKNFVICIYAVKEDGTNQLAQEFNSSPNDKILDWSIFKGFVDDKMNPTQNLNFVLTLSQTTNFRLPKLKEFAYDNFGFDENGRKFSKKHQKTLWEKEKLPVTCNFSFSLSVFKRLPRIVDT